MFLVYNMLAVHVLCLEYGLISISHRFNGGASGVSQSVVFRHFA